VARGPNPIDVYVGSRVRLRRTLLGLSQEKLANALGLTFQQVQKYERGLNRIGSSNLYKISRVLSVPVEFFFDDMPEELSEDMDIPAAEELFDIRQIGKRETVHFVNAFYRISDVETRERIMKLIQRLADTSE